MPTFAIRVFQEKRHPGLSRRPRNFNEPFLQSWQSDNALFKFCHRLGSEFDSGWVGLGDEVNDWMFAFKTQSLGKACNGLNRIQ